MFSLGTFLRRGTWTIVFEDTTNMDTYISVLIGYMDGNFFIWTVLLLYKGHTH